MKLTFILTNRCNAQCAHCITSSSPEDSSLLAPRELRDWIDQASVISESHDHFSVCFSGGEPFLYRNNIMALVRYAYERGARTSCVSNGFWATSYAEACMTVGELKKAGLVNLSLSHDEFHQPYVAFANVENAVRACSDMGLSFCLKHVRYKGGPGITEMLKKLEHLTVDQTFSVNEMLCMPLGRAETFPTDKFVFREAIPARKCVWLGTFVVNASGDFFPCCAPGWPKQLCMGNMRSNKLSELVNKAKRNTLLRILHEHGPAFFVPFLENTGCRFAHGSFVNECHLCNSVLTAALNDRQAHGAFRKAILDWEEKRRNERMAADTVHSMIKGPMDDVNHTTGP